MTAGWGAARWVWSAQGCMLLWASVTLAMFVALSVGVLFDPDRYWPNSINPAANKAVTEAAFLSAAMLFFASLVTMGNVIFRVSEWCFSRPRVKLIPPWEL